MKKFSRALAVTTVAFVGSASAVCPVFDNNASKLFGKNMGTIGMSAAADKMFNKNDHFQKAAFGTMGRVMDCKSPVAPEAITKYFVADLLIRNGSAKVNLDGYRDAAVKKLDVLPAGMIRDNVHPMVEGVAAVVTHPEFLTMLVMEYGVPFVVNMMKDK